MNKEAVMRICFVSRDTPSAFLQTCERKKCEREKGVDVTLFGFCGDEVSYEKELKGETDFFEELALLSKCTQGVVACGCLTDTHGHKRKSVAVAENGRILGVSDMLNAIDGEVSSGAALRVYETKVGRMGVVVAEDLLFPEIFKSLAVCGSDFIVCPFGMMEEIQPILLRACAYSYGVPVFFCADGYCMLADVTGNVAFASPQSPAYVDFTAIKEYHLVETRRRGFYKPRREK